MDDQIKMWHNKYTMVLDNKKLKDVNSLNQYIKSEKYKLFSKKKR